MTIQYELKEGTELTEEQKEELKAAASRPIVFDEDCPEMTPEMFKNAYRPGRRREGDMISLRVQVLPATLDKAKTLGSDYIALLVQYFCEVLKKYRNDVEYWNRIKMRQ